MISTLTPFLFGQVACVALGWIVVPTARLTFADEAASSILVGL